MKKSSSQKRALKIHYEVLQEFLENLAQVFPEDAELKDGILFNNNVVTGNETKMLEGVEAWVENMSEPLKKGSAKYMKAVESITGKPACVYHAFAYRDTAAMYASSSSPALQRLDLHEKMQSDAWDVKSKEICWEYLDELCRTAYDAVPGATPPSVPSRDDIQKDIARRKASSTTGASGFGSNPASQNNQSVNSGVKETFQRICLVREVQGAEDLCADTLAANLSKAASKTLCVNNEDVTLGDLCRQQVDKGFYGVMKLCHPEGDWGDETREISSEVWDLTNKCLGLATMKSAIPAPMMMGIENMANKLVNDIASGKTDMSSLNVEAIGQQVLSNVSPEEMSEFANNIDKILPALGQLKPF